MMSAGVLACLLHSTRIFSWLVPELTAIFLPATSAGPLIVRPLPFFASKARLSRRYVAKSYFCLRSSVTVILDAPTSYLALSSPMNRFSHELFSSSGAEIYLNPVEQYVAPGQSVDFYTVLEAARRRGETAIGYRIEANSHKADHGYGVAVNPLKTSSLSFTAGDKIIVLAEG